MDRLAELRSQRARVLLALRTAPDDCRLNDLLRSYTARIAAALARRTMDGVR